MLGIVLAESKAAKLAKKKEPKPVIRSVKHTPVKKEVRKRPVREYRSSLELCPVHHCFVSNWDEHFSRLGCSRYTAFKEKVA
jgi:hypothetical protein